MKTRKVNFITCLVNSFTETGRHANIQIAEMKLDAPSGKIYQRRLRNRNIGLLQKTHLNKPYGQTNCDCVVLINKDGSVSTKEHHTTTTASKKIIYSLKTLYGKLSNKIQTVEKTLLYAHPSGKFEESATKTVNHLMGTSELVVKCAAGNTSFPTTKLAGSLHPRMAEKSVLPNGDTIYIERYPQL